LARAQTVVVVEFHTPNFQVLVAADDADTAGEDISSARLNQTQWTNPADRTQQEIKDLRIPLGGEGSGLHESRETKSRSPRFLEKR
jgi:hypothetical protein